jgi:hypothetical protein
VTARAGLPRVGEIAAVTRDDSGRQQVQVRDHPEVLEVSRGYAHLFRAA